MEGRLQARAYEACVGVDMNIIFEPGAERWKDQDSFHLVLHHFRHLPGQAHVWPRRQVDGVMGCSTAPWAFRAVTRGGMRSDLFVDDTEIPESISWLLTHELTHQAIGTRPDFRDRLHQIRSTSDPASDAFHVEDSEERVCDLVATKLIGRRYDRAWWRNRVNLAKNGR